MLDTATATATATVPLARPRRGRLDIFRPGRRLMLSLRLRTKLALVAATLVLPMAVLMAFAVRLVLDDLSYIQTEVNAVDVATTLTPVVLQAQKLRTLDVRALSGDAQAQPLWQETRDALRQAVHVLDLRLAADLGYSLQDRWVPVRQALLALADGPRQTTVPASFQAHSAAIEALRELALLNGERSGLILDPEARSYHLMDVLVNSLLPVAEATSGIRALGAGALLRGASPPSERATVLGLCTELQRALKEVGAKLAALERAGGRVPSAWAPARAELSQLAVYARTLFVEEELQEDPHLFLDRGASAVSQVMALQSGLASDLLNELQDRRVRTLQRLAEQVGAVAAGLLLTCYLLWAFVVTSRASVRELSTWVQAIASGNLSCHRHVRGKDELADMGRQIEGMSVRLSALVSDIRSSATLVDQTGQRVAQGSGQLAIRTEEQANSLQNSVVAIEQLNGAVEQNAQAARELDALTGRLAVQAEAGNAQMGQTLQGMHSLQATTQKVVGMVAAINDIAFQTGMLALNAAVEAARAGPSGKGFAIVAAEVRQLATRCAETAEDIGQLVHQADEVTRQSLAQLLDANVAMADIVSGVQTVSDRLRLIAEASTQQSVGLHDVTRSVGNLNEINRHNAAMVEESATASNALVSRASSLREAVGSVRLRQGSADEALALVQRALSHQAEVGRQQAIADFHANDGGFIDRDLYLFALNPEGVFSVNGSRPDLVGSHFSEVVGLDASFADLVWDKARQGGGWIHYRVVHPITGQVASKESYVCEDGHGCAIGCGVFQLA